MDEKYNNFQFVMTCALLTNTQFLVYTNSIQSSRSKGEKQQPPTKRCDVHKHQEKYKTTTIEYSNSSNKM